MKRAPALLFALFVAVAASGLEIPNDTEITAANVIRLMNEYRAEEGLPPLAADTRLTQAAGDRMRHMEEEQYWSHESPAGMAPFVWLRSRAYDFQTAGENLAAGFETARVLVESWMESPGHRANIMSANFADCGIAIIEGSTRGPATGKSIVVLFGKKRETVETLVARGIKGQPR
jgi:uncharacterized protein YkwD